MQIILVALIALVPLAWAGSVNFSDCSGLNNVQKVTITNCDTKQCNLKIGTTVRLHAVFTSEIPATELYCTVKGLIRGREVNLPQPRVDGCKLTDKISPGCPLVNGKTYIYNDDFEIKSFFPPGPVTVTYSGENEKGEQIACVQIEARFTK